MTDAYYGESDIDYRLARERYNRIRLGEDYPDDPDTPDLDDAEDEDLDDEE